MVTLLQTNLNDKDVVRENCLAIYRLSAGSSEIKRKFFDVGFCEALMIVYRKYGQSNEINVRGLIRDFIAENDEIKERFLSLGESLVMQG